MNWLVTCLSASTGSCERRSRPVLWPVRAVGSKGADRTSDSLRSTLVTPEQAVDQVRPSPSGTLPMNHSRHNARSWPVRERSSLSHYNQPWRKPSADVPARSRNASEWMETQAGVFRFAFVKSEENRAVCILDLWKTLVVTVGYLGRMDEGREARAKESTIPRRTFLNMEWRAMTFSEADLARTVRQFCQRYNLASGSCFKLTCRPSPDGSWDGVVLGRPGTCFQGQPDSVENRLGRYSEPWFSEDSPTQMRLRFACNRVSRNREWFASHP